MRCSAWRTGSSRILRPITLQNGPRPPATWIRLYAATSDERYLNFAVTNWWRTTDYLYDTNEHLFFRDSTYFDKREANGKKVFWSRGNGWVMGGLVRMLQCLPMNSVAATPLSQPSR